MLLTKSMLYVALLTAGTYLNADIAEGEELFNDAQCLSCHDTNSFNHNEKKINSFSKLSKQVKMCEFNTNTGWFDEETMDVVLYLNQSYYHYKLDKK